MNIYIEFCEKWNYQPDFDRVSKQIKKIMPNAQIHGNTTPPPSKTRDTFPFHTLPRRSTRLSGAKTRFASSDPTLQVFCCVQYLPVKNNLRGLYKNFWVKNDLYKQLLGLRPRFFFHRDLVYSVFFLGTWQVPIKQTFWIRGGFYKKKNIGPAEPGRGFFLREGTVPRLCLQFP